MVHRRGCNENRGVRWWRRTHWRYRGQSIFSITDIVVVGRDRFDPFSKVFSFGYFFQRAIRDISHSVLHFFSRDFRAGFPAPAARKSCASVVPVATMVHGAASSAVPCCQLTAWLCFGRTAAIFKSAQPFALFFLYKRRRPARHCGQRISPKIVMAWSVLRDRQQAAFLRVHASKKCFCSVRAVLPIRRQT